MPPIFKCLICRNDIERSTKTFWLKKGHLLCSSCLDDLDKKLKKNQHKIHLCRLASRNSGDGSAGRSTCSLTRG